MDLSALNPKNWWGEKSSPQGKPLTSRETNAMGDWTQIFSKFEPREVNPHMYEAFREAIPVIDAAINRLVTMDGIVRVEGENELLVSEIEEWMESVQVGDLQTGFQAFYAGMGNELYEQGFAIGEPTLDEDLSAVIRLDVADSKGVYFKRDEDGLKIYYRKPSKKRGSSKGTENVESVLRNNYSAAAGNVTSYLGDNDYTEVSSTLLVYAGLNNEACNPYGVSIMRSMEFVSKVLLTMDNATMQTWERFGSPSFDVQYKTKSKLSEKELGSRRKKIADNIKSAMDTKRSGNTVDLVNAIGINDEIEIKILGGDGTVLEIEQPAKHIMEQVVAKTGLPPWILGYVWGTAERLALKQAELLLQESKTRFALRKPGLEKVVATHLRAKGITWNKGDWHLVQELPNMQDLLAIAQANFLEAQTELMQSNAGSIEGAVVDSGTGKVLMPGDEDYRLTRISGKALHSIKAKGDPGEPRAEDDAELDRIEKRAIEFLLAAWRSMLPDVLEILGVEASGNNDKAATKSDDPVFAYDPAVMMQLLLELETEFVQMVGAEDAELASEVFNAWVRGELNAAAEFDDVSAILDEVRVANRAAINERTMDMVRNVTARALREDIIVQLDQGMYDGKNPVDVARALRKRFEAHEYDWERLARSEITDAHARGKLDQYRAMDIDQYEYKTSEDSKVSSICRTLAAAGPYLVGYGPMPMRDSHPNCRCTVTAVSDI